MISESISDDIPVQMKILNMVISLLMHFCSFVLNWSDTSCIKQRDSERQRNNSVITGVKLFPTVYSTIYCSKFFTLSIQILHFKIKCIRMVIFL